MNYCRINLIFQGGGHYFIIAGHLRDSRFIVIPTTGRTSGRGNYPEARRIDE